MHLNNKDIQNLDRKERILLINSITGIKPGNLIGTISNEGITNLAVFSSIVHLGSDPALLGFILRSTGEVPRHTYENILETQEYTINHIPINNTKKAHYTSAKFDKSVSEFHRCGFTEEFTDGFKAPFVKESPVKIGMNYCETIEIPRNGTKLIIGKIEQILLPDHKINYPDLNLELCESAGISGLNTYYSFNKIENYPYARLNEVPDF